jgi:hypothetical protein
MVAAQTIDAWEAKRLRDENAGLKDAIVFIARTLTKVCCMPGEFIQWVSAG